MNYLITGGAGFIGNALALALSSAGHEVVILDNLNDYYDVSLKEARLARLPASLPFKRVDLSDRESLRQLFAEYNFDVVFHLAAQAGVRYSLQAPEKYIESNYLGTFTVLEMMREFGVKKLIYASTSSVYGEDTPVPFTESATADRPVSVYAATKRGGELLAHTYYHLHDIEVTALRFFTVYGPWGRPDMALYTFTDKILRGETITLFNEGNMRRDFTYIDDIVAGIILAAKRMRGYSVYNLGRGEPVRLIEFIHAIELATGKSASLDYAPLQPGDVTKTEADIHEAVERLGYAPKTSITEGVARYVAWFRDYYGY
jgi:UDP-glucuronate 4-epimerase